MNKAQKILVSLTFFYIILATFCIGFGLMSGCGTQQSGSTDSALGEDASVPLVCQGQHLEARTPTGAEAVIDGETRFLRDPADLYTSEQLINSVDFRNCPLCMSNPSVACSRHFEDVDCSLLPARPTVPHASCTNPDIRLCSTCTKPTVLVQCDEGLLQLSNPCGCDEDVSLSSTGRVLCPNGDAWNPLAILLF